MAIHRDNAGQTPAHRPPRPNTRPPPAHVPGRPSASPAPPRPRPAPHPLLPTLEPHWTMHCSPHFLCSPDRASSPIPPSGLNMSRSLIPCSLSCPTHLKALPCPVPPYDSPTLPEAPYRDVHGSPALPCKVYQNRKPDLPYSPKLNVALVYRMGSPNHILASPCCPVPSPSRVVCPAPSCSGGENTLDHSEFVTTFVKSDFSTRTY